MPIRALSKFYNKMKTLIKLRRLIANNISYPLLAKRKLREAQDISADINNPERRTSTFDSTDFALKIKEAGDLYLKAHKFDKAQSMYEQASASLGGFESNIAQFCYPEKKEHYMQRIEQAHRRVIEGFEKLYKKTHGNPAFNRNIILTDKTL